MNNAANTRQANLLKIAEQDNIYQVWARSFEDCKDAFAQFAATQPEEIRNMLYGYADCGRMMMQKMVNLACEHMVFPEENYSPPQK